MSTAFAATAQQILGVLLGQADALVGVKDPEGRYVFGNPALERAFDIAPGTVAGRRDEELLPTELVREIAAREHRVRDTGVAACEEERFDFGGSRRAYLTARYPYRNPEGSIIGTGFVAMDITPRIQAELQASADLAQIRATNEQLQSALVELQARASVDRLTGAWNRARFEEAAKGEMHRLQRYGHPVSLLFFDLDHFKQVNDTHGHAAGDRVLIEVSAATRTTYRANDALGRWGGEEFVVLAPNTGLDGAASLAERIRTAIASLDLSPMGPVTASFGVAECRRNDSWETWLERADQAAYSAKRGGRNRVELCPPEPGEQPGIEHIEAAFVRLVWHPAYDSGNALVDTQHRLLFQVANELLHSVLDSRPASDVDVLIDRLLEEVVQHFRDEERVFTAAGYPGAEEHTRIHAALVEQAAERVAAFRQRQVGVGALFQFLAHDVIARHMLVEDRRFFPYLSRSLP